ncbi:MAG: hypothetical protein ACLQDM_28070 [Bradyrhizobium sp.]
MRLFAMLAAISVLSQSALAGTPECKAVADAGARLACYDKANTPAASADKSVAGKPAAPIPVGNPAAHSDSAKYVDTIGAEDVRMNAQLKNICRGC